MNLTPRLSRDANLENLPNGWRFSIPTGPATHYRLSQLDDHPGLPRAAYPWGSPTTLSLRVRVSSKSTPGTWGFGLWNDPFGFSFGPGENFFRPPALPNTIWFFFASPKNYLSFRDDRPAQGFLAQVFRSPSFHPGLISAALTLPFAPRRTRRIVSRFIEEDAAAISVDVTQWHAYRLEWSPNRSAFQVDGAPVLESSISPRGPLGLVLWIDNQFAAFTPEGKLRWGLEENPHPEWLEIKDLDIKT